MTRRTCLFAAAIAGLLSSPLAFAASKDVRDTYKRYDIDKAIKESAAKIQASCGCRVAVEVNQESFTQAVQLGHVNKLLSNVGDVAAKYCSDAASKKELCDRVEKVVVSGAAKGKLAAKLAGKKLDVYTDGDFMSDRKEMADLIAK